MRHPHCIRRRLLRICEQSYSPDRADAICRWSAVAAGGDNPAECRLDEDSALVGTIDLDGGKDAIVIAFRGTLAQFGSDEARVESTLDWLNNGECAQVPFRNAAKRTLGKVHAGFLESVNKVWPGVKASLDRLIAQDPARPIYVTGHSKGGAMANLAAMRIKDLWPKASVRVVTFAGARPGDADFAAAYAASGIASVRYESWPDPVPELPPGPGGSWWLKTVVAPLFRIGRLRQLRVADLDPFYPVGTRVPAGSWMGDATRRGIAILTNFFGFRLNPRKLILAHAIDSGTAYDELVCSDAGADRCDHG